MNTRSSSKWNGSPAHALRRSGAWKAVSGKLEGTAVHQRARKVWRRLEANGLDPLELAQDYVLSSLVGIRNRADLRQARCFVLFVGYPRSGHTIVGSLLNAHPDMVIGQRIRILRYLNSGFRRHQLEGMVLIADRRFGRVGRLGNKRYDYSVPHQWQGRFRQLRVLGDSNVVSTYLADHPQVLAELRRTIEIPVRIVHVVRNPFDTISTMSMRNETSLPDAAERYFTFCDTSVTVRRDTADTDWAELRHEELLGDPQGSLRRLCEFLEVPVADGYLADCAGILYSKPHTSRHEVTWTPELIAAVAERAGRFGFLDGYRFEDAAPEDAVTDT